MKEGDELSVRDAVAVLAVWKTRRVGCGREAISEGIYVCGGVG